jgi:hypothetical protein
MEIDRDLVKETIKKALIESREFINRMEGILGREIFYRYLFKYPKKWSRRKVKKIGSRDIQYTRLDFGMAMVRLRVSSLGKEYENIFSEDV